MGRGKGGGQRRGSGFSRDTQECVPEGGFTGRQPRKKRREEAERRNVKGSRLMNSKFALEPQRPGLFPGSRQVRETSPSPAVRLLG